MTKNDNFDRGNSSSTLGGNWTVGSGPAWGIFSNEAYAAGGGGRVYWSADAFDGDHTSQFTVGVFASVQIISPAVRVQTNGDAYWYDTGNVYKTVSGSTTPFTSSAMSDNTFATGDIFKMTATGSTIKVFKNGVEIFSQTDTDLTGGAPGMSAGTNIITANDWEGTDATGGGGGGGSVGYQNIMLLGVG